jgi:ADP-ribose pyrophosphatase YjhB (NUDIX family)
MSFDFTFCPRCGAPLSESLAFGRRRPTCRYCGFIQFHDPKVAVAALVSGERRVLLVRRAVIPRLGFWALPAGYMDQDELPEEAVVREVAEETGITIRVRGLRTVASLGGWERRRGILLVYDAEPLAQEAVVAADDVSDARWFTAAEVPWEELAFDSTASLLREWAARF